MIKNHGSWWYDFYTRSCFFFLKQIFSPGNHGFERHMFTCVYWPRQRSKWVDVGPFLNHTDVHRSSQHKHLRYVINALSHWPGFFFSKSIFAAWLSSCFNEGTRNWHMFATTRVVSISLTITRVTNIVRFTEVSLYRGSLHEGSSVLSQSSSSSLVHKIIWAQLIILCDPPILTMWATR